jgi:hypothetical protein
MLRKPTLGYLLALLLFIVALPTTINDGIAGWASWLSWLGDREWQWILAVAGLVIIVLASWPRLVALSRRAAELVTQSRPDHEAPHRADSQEAIRAEPTASYLPALSEAVRAERARRSRIADLVAARVEEAQELRWAFDAFIETFLARRAEFGEGMDAEAMERAREEYGRLHLRVTAAYRKLRDHYRRFLREEPQYDRSSNDPDDFVPEEPLADWWRPLTFDAELARYANASDDHLRPFIAEERAILDAFKEWIAEPRAHDLARDLAGADLESEETLGLIGQRLTALELQRASRENRAELSARQGAISGREFGDEYSFEVMNTGPAAARNVRAWAAPPPSGQPATGEVQMHTLPPDHRWYQLTLTIGRQAFSEEGLLLVLAWDDRAGSHEDRVLEVRPLQR